MMQTLTLTEKEKVNPSALLNCCGSVAYIRIYRGVQLSCPLGVDICTS